MKTYNEKLMPPGAVDQLVANGGSILLDVRTDVEFAEQHVPGSCHIQLDRLADRFHDLDESAHYSLLCLGGKRAENAFEILTKHGFEKLTVVEGGVTAWQAAGLPVRKSSRSTLPLMRQVQLAIGVLAFTGSLLAIFVNPLFAILPAFLGAGLILAGSTGWCGLAILLSKMPWNRCETSGDSR